MGFSADQRLYSESSRIQRHETKLRRQAEQLWNLLHHASYEDATYENSSAMHPTEKRDPSSTLFTGTNDICRPNTQFG
jgi:hypothetical protein